MIQSAALQEELSFIGRKPVSKPVSPWIAHPEVRDALDRVDRLESCLHGFKVMLSQDPDRLSGKSLEDVEVLMHYLMEEHEGALTAFREATWAALGGKGEH